MDLRKLKTLIDLVSDSNISELEITEAEGKVRIVKTAPVAAGVMTYAQPMMQMPQQQAAPVAAAAMANVPASIRSAMTSWRAPVSFATP